MKSPPTNFLRVFINPPYLQMPPFCYKTLFEKNFLQKIKLFHSLKVLVAKIINRYKLYVSGLMLELVDNRDLKSRAPCGRPGSSPGEATIFPDF